MSLQVAKVKDIPIKLHYTLIIVFFLISWTVSSGFMPTFYPGLSTFQYWIMGAVAAGILFISVLLHELAHSLLSIRYGLKVRQIILFIFGGVSDIRDEPKDYHKEFKIAIVGPLTSFALALGFFLTWIIILQTAGPIAQPNIENFYADTLANKTSSSPPISGGPNDEPKTLIPKNQLTQNPTVKVALNEVFIRIISGILMYGAIVNALLGGFNLLPAFPLDGGRVLRAVLTRWKKNFDEATRISVKAGVAISYALMALGFLSMLSGSFVGGLWLIILGWFLQSGAQAYLQQHEISSKLSHIKLKEIMNRQYVSVDMDDTVANALRNYFDTYRKSEFPVVDRHGYLIGSISSRQIMDLSDNLLENTKVVDIMTPLQSLIIMDPQKSADEALKKLMEQNKSRIFVCVKNSITSPSEKDLQIYKWELLGIISKTDLLNTVSEQEEYEKSIRRLGPKP